MDSHTLDPRRVLATIRTLRERIRERFPDANLGNIADDLIAIATEHAARSQRIRRPNWFLRGLSIALLLGGVAMLVGLGLSLHVQIDTDLPLTSAIQTIEATLSALFFLGAGAVFLISLDLRSRRRRCLEALHELRAMAHIVDMHQLTKDPERGDPRRSDTPSSPRQAMNAFELERYLDYCSEMLSLMGKLAALYVQDFPDAQAVAAVDEIENLTTGLSRKIWQKIMVIGSRTERAQGLAP